MAKVIIKFRRNSQAWWESHNPILRDGEPGVVKESGYFKIGDGETRWNDLPLFTTQFEEPPASSLTEHILDPQPHPAYDNGPSLALLYHNAKV